MYVFIYLCIDLFFYCLFVLVYTCISTIFCSRTVILQLLVVQVVWFLLQFLCLRCIARSAYVQSMQSVSEGAEDPVAWVNQQVRGDNDSVTSGSDNYMVISIKKKRNVTELKIPGARV